jgi:hypothetical protein
LCTSFRFAYVTKLSVSLCVFVTRFQLLMRCGGIWYGSGLLPIRVPVSHGFILPTSLIHILRYIDQRLFDLEYAPSRSTFRASGPPLAPYIE